MRARHAVTAGLIVLVTALIGASRMGAQAGDVPFKIVRLDPALDRIVSPDARLELLGDKFGLAEGPVWIQDPADPHLLFSDVAANVIYRWSPARPSFSIFLDRAGYTGKDTLNVGQQTTSGGRVAILLIGPNGLTRDPQQRLVICAMTDRNVVRIERDGTRTVLAERYQGKRFSGPNDVIVKSDGAVYFTDSVGGLRGGDDSPQRELPYNGFYLVKDGTVTLLGSDEGHPADFPNGIGLSPDEKYLYVTAGFGKTYRYTVRPDDTVSDGKLFVETGNDGLKVDSAGGSVLVQQRARCRRDLDHLARGEASRGDPDAAHRRRAAAADLRDQRGVRRCRCEGALRHGLQRAVSHSVEHTGDCSGPAARLTARESRGPRTRVLAAGPQAGGGGL